MNDLKEALLRSCYLEETLLELTWRIILRSCNYTKEVLKIEKERYQRMNGLKMNLYWKARKQNIHTDEPLWRRRLII